MRRIQSEALFLVLIALSHGLVGCGWKGSPPPEVDESSVDAKQQKPSSSLHGRIVAIMADGHVEPARVPQITLVRIVDKHHHYDIEGVRDTVAYREWSERLPIGPTEMRLNCSQLFRAYFMASAAAQAADLRRLAEDKSPGEAPTDLLVLKGDEDGYFELEDIDHDRYLLVAYGQAGWYPNVLWEDIVDVEAGKQTKVTINSVVRMCK
jgi:hypothetical protein